MSNKHRWGEMVAKTRQAQVKVLSEYDKQKERLKRKVEKTEK
jgi:hypothetical protein